MNIHLRCVYEHDSIDLVLKAFEEWIQSNSDFEPIVIVTDSSKKIVGVIADGDIRRCLLKNIDSIGSVKAKDIANYNFYSVTEGSQEYLNLISLKNSSLSRYPSCVDILPVLDVHRQVQFGLSLHYLSQLAIGRASSVSIIGLGYVGISLTAAATESFETVQGVEIISAKVRSYNNGDYLTDEPGVAPLLSIALQKYTLKFVTPVDMQSTDAYIICVGTSINDDKTLNTGPIEGALDSICEVLKPKQQVYIRSTVPVGFTSTFVSSYIKNRTGLDAGKDYTLGFAPERTIEGNALKEIHLLPQIVSTVNPDDLQKASYFWEMFAQRIIPVSTPETAELAKLANNSFRDLSFAFSNQLGLLSERFNINTFELVSACSDGYTRNPIPLPSPGVGGYCLTKDPYLLMLGNKDIVTLSHPARGINELAQMFPVNAIEVANYKVVNAAVLGISFKGHPENTDLRFSPVQGLIDWLEKKTINFSLFDFAIKDGRKFKTKAILNGESLNLEEFDSLFIMNNHIRNAELDLSSIILSKKQFFIFDGWNQYSQFSRSRYDNFIYSTIGYVSSLHL